MIQSTTARRTRRGNILRLVVDEQPPVHQPWCHPGQHDGNECRSEPIPVSLHPGTEVTSATAQWVHKAGESTKARVHLPDSTVFDLEPSLATTLTAALESLLMTLIGNHAAASTLARNARTQATEQARALASAPPAVLTAASAAEPGRWGSSARSSYPVTLAPVRM